MKAVAMSPQYRERSVDRLSSEHFDMLVVGGGVVGCGVALDAVTRGMKVALVEADDFAAGTSSRSSKLVHGGLRYLEMLDFALVSEALGERGRLIEKIAPHLVRPVPFLFPLQHPMWDRMYIGAGVALYDAMASVRGRGGVPLHRHMSRKKVREVAPGVRTDALAGAIQYYDAQVDDARFTMTLARTAADYGAVVTTEMKLTELVQNGDTVTGGVVVDVPRGRTIQVSAQCVINATGVWHDDVTSLVTDEPGFSIQMSKGVHLVVPKTRIDSSTGIIIRTAMSVLFVIPWSNDHWIIGTTDTAWTDGDSSAPTATAEDISYLLTQVNRVLNEPLTVDDVVGVYAGLRPLVHGESSETVKLSREHAVLHPVPGLVSIAGGKYTTYRVMADDAINEAVSDIDAQLGPCCTADLPLVGAVGFQGASNSLDHVTRSYGISESVASLLLSRYGSAFTEVLAPCDDDPTLALTVDGAPRYLNAEVRYSVTHEGARHLDDILSRRTRVAIEAPDGGVRAAYAVADIVGPLLSWTADETSREIAEYTEKSRLERAAVDQLVMADR